MKRQDYDLAKMLKYENIAWYEDGIVKILDRRVYPVTERFEICRTHQEVAKAITDMVTQSGGPYTAARMGMALAAYECRDLKSKDKLEYLNRAAKTLSQARPTTSKRMKLVTDKILQIAKYAIDNDLNLVDEIMKSAIDSLNEKYLRYGKLANYLVDLFPKSGTIMTQCFGEVIVGLMLREAKERNLDIKVICPETRPYFQGARLTSTVCSEQGFDTTIITDNAVAFTMKQGVDLFTSAADAICLDGHVVNKIGTYQMAMVANNLGIPYFVTGVPDIAHPDIDTVEIEYRDGDFVLQAMGVPTTNRNVKGFYPSFDITPPHLISGVVTDKGIFSPYDLDKYEHEGFVEP
ncbi:MAG: S-methyl-5-thioribose-1-phosphate isomerase [Tissierellia bacterium]|nr:S-methyl-5-thioribose-1-phosphate isomerase [Tissierellia bacterium]